MLPRTVVHTIGRWYLLYFLESPYFIDEATFKGTANQQRIVEKIEQLMQLLLFKRRKSNK